jgi:hypothetical protein
VFSILDSVLGDTLSLPLTSTNVTLTTDQAQNNFIDLSGTITQNIVITFPQIGRNYVVRNGTTGNFTVTLKTSAASGAVLVIPQGAIRGIILNGTDVLRQISPPAKVSFSNNTTQTLTNNNTTAVNFTTSSGTAYFGTYTPSVISFNLSQTFAITATLTENVVNSGPATGTFGYIEIRKNGVAILGSQNRPLSTQGSPNQFILSTTVIEPIVAGDGITLIAAVAASANFTSGSVTFAGLSITPVS